MTSGAGLNYCSRCVAQTEFFGVLEKDAFKGLAPVTLGLSAILKFVLRSLLLKPVCVECASKIKWSAQHYHWESERPRSEYERQREPLRVVSAKRLPRETIRGSDLSALYGRYRASANTQRAEPPEPKGNTIDWPDRYSGTGLIKTSGDSVVAKVVAGYGYHPKSWMVNDGEGVIGLHNSYASDNHWVVLYRKTGFCLRPWKLPKWSEVAHLSLRGPGNVHAWRLRDSDTVVAFGGRSFGTIDAKNLLKSARHDYSKAGVLAGVRHYVQDVQLCDDDAHAVIFYQDYYTSRYHAAAIAIETGELSVDFGEFSEKPRVLCDRSGIVALASDVRLSVGCPGGRKLIYSNDLSGQILEGRMAGDGSRLIVAVNADDKQHYGNPSALASVVIEQLEIRGA